MTGADRSKASNPVQGDLLSGQWLNKLPTRGSGKHVRLTELSEAPQAAVPGMADFSGGGPAGTYCQDCQYFADEIAVQIGVDAIERANRGCAIWARRMAHAAPSPKRDLRACRSCKRFEPTNASPRLFVIDTAGEVYRLDRMPENLQAWLRDSRDSIGPQTL